MAAGPLRDRWPLTARVHRVLRSRAIEPGGRGSTHYLQHVPGVRRNRGAVPVDDQTLAYLRFRGHPGNLIDLVERYAKEQTRFCTDEVPTPPTARHWSSTSTRWSRAWRARPGPQDRVALSGVWDSFTAVHGDDGNEVEVDVSRLVAEGGHDGDDIVFPSSEEGSTSESQATVCLKHGCVVIAPSPAAPTPPTPRVMGAGLVTKKAVERGLTTKPWVKTSTAPGCARRATRVRRLSHCLVH
jgi:aconitate hydratase